MDTARRLASLIHREVLIQWSLRPVAWTQLLYPAMYIFVAGYAYGALIRTVRIGAQEVPYLYFLVPGIVASQVMVAATFAGQTFASDRRTHMLAQILVMPYLRWEYLVSKVAGGVFRGGVTGLFVIAIATPIVVRMPLTPKGIAVAAGAITLTAILFGSLMFFIGALVREAEVLNVVFSIVAIPVLFLSSVFYPLEGAPTLIRVLGTWNPLSQYADLVRYGLLNQPVVVDTWRLLGSVAVGLVALLLACLAFQRIEP